MIWWTMFGNGTKIGVITENNTGCYEEVLGTLTAIRIIAGIANPDSAVCQDCKKPIDTIDNS